MIINLSDQVSKTAYPGRGIAIGQSDDGRSAVVIYILTGRSENSRNRVLTVSGRNVYTAAHDEKKMADPSLIIYRPVCATQNGIIITNGDQTDTIESYISKGKTFIDALKTRTFEPDAPYFTPRISGLVNFSDGAISYSMGVIKRAKGENDICLHQFFEYERAWPGTCHFVNTYSSDNLSAFEGEPVNCAIHGDIDDLSQSLWQALNKETRIALFIGYVDIFSGQTATRVINNF